MAKVFEELEVWREARELTAYVYKLSGSGKFGKDFGLAGQVRKAAVSVMSNIAEGFARGSNKEFARFLFIARGSLAEVNSQLYVAVDLGYIDEDEFEKVNDRVKQLSKRITAFISKLDPKKKFERRK